MLKLKDNAYAGSALMYFEPGADRQGNSHEVACGVITVNDSSKPGGIRYDFYIGNKVIVQDV